MLDKVLNVIPSDKPFTTVDLYHLVSSTYGGNLNDSGKSNVRNSLVILLDFNMLEHSKENNNYILIKDKSEMPKRRQYNQRKDQPIDNSVTMIEKRALNWYPNANYGKILELLDELGYKHIPSPKTEIKDVVRIYLHYRSKQTTYQQA